MCLQTVVGAELETCWSGLGRWAHPGVRPQSLCRWLGVGRQLASDSPLSCQSCYEHIQKEDMHRLPSHWDSGEPW